jgi:hypothetical protein
LAHVRRSITALGTFRLCCWILYTRVICSAWHASAKQGA